MENLTVIVSGGSRGIGKAIALKCAQNGANVAILAKTVTPHPRLPGTIYSACEEINQNCNRDCAFPVACDLRSHEQISDGVAAVMRRFGRIDVVVNNASAIHLASTVDCLVKKYDLMQAVGPRGTYLLTQACLQHLSNTNQQLKHIVCISPPLTLKTEHFANHVAYTTAKYGMSMAVLGWAGEFAGRTAVNAMWPRTMINTAALTVIDGISTESKRSRTVDIMADAVYNLLLEPVSFTGNFLIDEAYLAGKGVNDFSKYKTDPECREEDLIPDLFLPEKI